MPDDKYNGLYIHKELVKGNWYGICSGPKPQVYTGNIDTASNLEDIRNKALYIVSPSSANGTFPVYGHKSAVLTTRYGSDVYLQRLFDIDAGVEWERAKIGSTSWYAWKRVTTEGDASATATAADQRSRNNATAINQIDSAIGGRTASPNINSRVSSNTSAIGSLNTDYGNFKNSTNLSISALTSKVNDHTTKMGKLLNQSDTQRLINVHMGCSVIDVPSGDSSLFPYWNNEASCRNWARDRGCTSENSVMFASTGYIMPGEKQGSGHGVHVEGMQFSNSSGCWYITFDSSTIPSERIYGLYVNWILFVNNGTWN